MTPRDEEVAFLLEGVRGVVGAWAVRGRPEILDAVRTDGPRAVVGAHYALRQVLSYEECERTRIFLEEPPALRAEMEALHLDSATREAARARLAERPPPPSPLPHVEHADPWPGPQGPSVLIVDGFFRYNGIEGEVRRAFGRNAAVACEDRVARAVASLASQTFDMVLCSNRAAYGPNGLVPALRATQPTVSARVLVVVERGAELSAEYNRRMNAASNVHLYEPLDADDLRLALVDPSRVTRRAHSLSSTRSTPRPIRRVLLIAERATPVTGKRFVMTVAQKPWDAFDRIEEHWDLVICSPKMRFGKHKLHAALWQERPELKSRFAFLAEAPIPEQPRVLVLPLGEAAVEAMLDRIDYLAAPE